MLVVLLVYCGRAFFVSRATDLLPDEILTFSEAQLPSLHTLWWTLKNSPTALDPPLHPFLCFFAWRLPLPFPLDLRLPAMVGYGALCLSLFVFLRRRAFATVALIASVIPMLLPEVFRFAVEARPYAMVLGFTGWALVFWQRAAERRQGRIGVLIGLYLCLSGVLLSHYLGGLVFVPLAAGELWRSFRQGRDPVIWAAFAAAALAALTYIPFLPAGAIYRAHPWHGVLASDLWRTYLAGVAPTVIIAITFCSLLWLWYQRSDYRGPAINLRQYETVALAVFYLVPAISFAIAKAATHSYVPRYSLMFSLAVAVATSVLIYCLTRHIRGLAALVFLALLVYATVPIVKGIIRGGRQNTGGIVSSSLPILDKLPALPIVVTNFDDYGKLYSFGPPTLKRRIVVVSDPSAITQFGNNVGLATEAVVHALHAPAESYRQLVQSDPRFLLLGSYWLRGKVLRDGCQVKLLGKIFDWDLYEVIEAGAAAPGNAHGYKGAK